MKFYIPPEILYPSSLKHFSAQKRFSFFETLLNSLLIKEEGRTLKELRNELSSFAESQHLIEALVEMNFISRENRLYKLNEPFFIEADTNVLQKMIATASSEILSLLQTQNLLKNEEFSPILKREITDEDLFDLYFGSILNQCILPNLFSLLRIPEKYKTVLPLFEDQTSFAQQIDSLPIRWHASSNFRFEFISFSSMDSQRSDFSVYLTSVERNSYRENEELAALYKILGDVNGDYLLTQAGQKLLKMLMSDNGYAERRPDIFTEVMIRLKIIEKSENGLRAAVPVYPAEISLLLQRSAERTWALMKEKMISIHQRLIHQSENLAAVPYGVDHEKILAVLWKLILGKATNSYFESISKPLSQGSFHQFVMIK